MLFPNYLWYVLDNFRDLYHTGGQKYSPKHHAKPGRWLMPILLAVLEAEIGRILVRANPSKNVCETSVW
jgi:hypothetical protein